MRVFVARHAETTWNLAGRYQGRRESALTALGIRQGFALADAFATLEPRIERIVASPLLRCSATARFVAERLNVTLEHDDRLLEIAHGTWEGRLRSEIASDEPELLQRWQTAPQTVRFDGGESLADVDARWHSFAASLQPRTPTLVVTHDVVVRLAILAARRAELADFWDVAVENAAYATFDVNGARWTLENESTTTHLAGLRAQIEAQAL